MKKMFMVVFTLIIFACCIPLAAQDLPDDVLADMYLLEASEALENGDARTAIEAYGKIEALDVEPPLEFLYFYGKVLVENSITLDDLLKGQSLLKQFVLNIEKDSEHYTPTLKLLSAVGKTIKKIDAKRQAEARAKREREAERQLLKEMLQSFQMVQVVGGTFTMGCKAGRDSDCLNSEKPAHRVRVRRFEIGKYEVTQEQWEAVIGNNLSHFKGCPQCPVEKVSWEDVQAFLKRLNDATGRGYRLPSEAEWEYAARGGQQSRGYQYAGSDDPDLVAWYDDNSGEKTHPVGRKRANELGLHDMNGNVIEWVQDCWHDDYEDAPNDGRAWETQGGGDCYRRVLRGGSWDNYGPRKLRAANRGWADVGSRYLTFGFRIARTLD